MGSRRQVPGTGAVCLLAFLLRACNEIVTCVQIGTWRLHPVSSAMMFKPSPQLCARLRFTTKDVGKGFYRGNRTGSMGSHTEFGGYVVDWRKTPHYNAPNTQDFPLTPFVTLEMERTTRVIERADGTSYTPDKVDGMEFLRQWARLNPAEYEPVVEHQRAERQTQAEWLSLPEEERTRIEAEREESRRQEMIEEEARQLEIVMENKERRIAQEEEDRRWRAEREQERQLQAREEQARLAAEEEERRLQAEEEELRRQAAEQRLRTELKSIRETTRQEVERTLAEEGHRRKNEGLPPMNRAQKRIMKAEIFAAALRLAGLDGEVRSLPREEQLKLLSKEEIARLHVEGTSQQNRPQKLSI
ncbi:hypothetical protein ABEF92_002885 [Exophiala dermatitidis]|uniref:Uncharacterized protein n=1 Tax=Exophiala dermatitidis (strain ATCC 34100 / CBS 525.76 / NIH/UT8656) TaxID=858893 RepID=H6CBD3_EXODN|nr:uncharacterized protein HMPREF1120_09018 [Exophiala dermatitidis NIH/UT8656]EHY61080.1 hypothetical protein HMPREF1120_09018 [Exophiala dermatitidis NIH/UT8656]